MNSYVAYIDLLGIKDMAKYSVEAYYNAIESFTCELDTCTSVFEKKEYKNSFVYYFSDCAFIQCENFDALFTYMINLRYRLIQKNSPLMFTAAIEVNISDKNTDQALKKQNNSKYINGISFANKNICSVYVLQNNFKGIGIFIDDQVLIEWEKTLRAKDKFLVFDKEQYISKSFFFPTIYSQNPVCYYDLKLTKPELETVYFENVLRRYHSADFKNKKYGRFYLSYLANWIVSELYYYKQKEKKEDINLLLFSCLIGDDDYIIGNLRKHAYKFDFLLFFLLNEFINLELDRDCPEEFLSLVKYIISSTTTKKYLNDLTLQVPECILSNKNKDKFINTYQQMLLQRKGAKKKTKKKE
ncbi:hypothetical protein [uncultured Bacteroides sp.]|uniref:hypothetical protein n=1 Tax=uncultured Bacteroides sp. TaxID=162156 RepID=UPI002AAC1A3A|nr:hypothetical protein [uncultured Bacteroides sp.]